MEVRWEREGGRRGGRQGLGGGGEGGFLQPRRGVEQPLVALGAQQRQHRVEAALHRRRLDAGLPAGIVEREAAQLGELALWLQPG